MLKGERLIRKVGVRDSVGMILCHDITKVVFGEFKGRAFKKGHRIREEDIDELLKLGKENIYVWENKPGMMHEDESALRIAEAICGDNVIYDQPIEGKCTLKSTVKGLFKVNSSLLYEINSIDDITIASLPNDYIVEKDKKLAGARIIPLMTEEMNIERVEELTRLKGPVFEIKPYKKMKIGIITTGNEVFNGLIEDKFGDIIKEKMKYFEAEVVGHTICPDNIDMIQEAIVEFIDKKVNMVILTGGMSIDPDDLTPGAIRNSGAKVVTYGAPVQPGNMFMLAYLGKVVLMGVPGAALYYKTTILDVVLPKIFVGEKMVKDDFVKMGEGGFCLACKVCTYPLCYFTR